MKRTLCLAVLLCSFTPVQSTPAPSFAPKIKKAVEETVRREGYRKDVETALRKKVNEHLRRAQEMEEKILPGALNSLPLLVAEW